MKKSVIILLIFGMIFYFLFNPGAAVSAAANGLLIWYSRVLPALLPFSIISNWMVLAGLPGYLENRMETIAHKERGISVSEWIAILCGFLFGFPIGSKMAADLCENGEITPRQAQIICCFANHMSPAFVGGYVVTSVLRCPEKLWPTYAIVYVPSFVLCILMLQYERKKNPPGKNHKKPASGFDINMQIIDAGIQNGCETLIKLCGYIVIFSIGVSALDLFGHIPPRLKIVITGFLEITNGIAQIDNCHYSDDTKYILAIMFLAFGGISGIAQTGSMIKKANLSIGKYAIAKLLLSVVSALLAIAYLFTQGSFG